MASDTERISREPALAALTRQAGRLLRVGSVSSAAQQRAGCHAVIVLSFDLGHLVIEPDAEGTALCTALRDGASALPPDLATVDEETPWWTLLGAAVSRSWLLRVSDGRCVGLELQFREDHENPKVISFRLQAASVEVFAAPKSEWEKRDVP